MQGDNCHPLLQLTSTDYETQQAAAAAAAIIFCTVKKTRLPEPRSSSSVCVRSIFRVREIRALSKETEKFALKEADGSTEEVAASQKQLIFRCNTQLFKAPSNRASLILTPKYIKREYR